jgi:PIN domain nuclease of toxin-antitoxin system
VRLLLDTHALLWWLADSPVLSIEARTAIANADNLVAVSAATAWEISIKRSLGKLDAPDDLEEQLDASGFIALPITLADGIAAGRLPRHHDDPFDRMLVAQAQNRGLTIISRDQRLALYGIERLPA